MDLAESIPTSVDLRKYLITFVNQFSRFTHVTDLLRKNDAPMAFDLCKKTDHVYKYFKHGVVTLHSDSGGEYKNADDLNSSTTTIDTHQHNPFAKRVNRMYFELMRTMLEQAGLSAKYWEYAVDHIAYVKNRLPHSALNCSTSK